MTAVKATASCSAMWITDPCKPRNWTSRMSCWTTCIVRLLFSIPTILVDSMALCVGLCRSLSVFVGLYRSHSFLIFHSGQKLKNEVVSRARARFQTLRYVLRTCVYCEHIYAPVRYQFGDWKQRRFLDLSCRPHGVPHVDGSRRNMRKVTEQDCQKKGTERRISDRQTDKQTDKQTDWQTDRQTKKPRVKERWAESHVFALVFI